MLLFTEKKKVIDFHERDNSLYIKIVEKINWVDIQKYKKNSIKKIQSLRVYKVPGMDLDPRFIPVKVGLKG